jgi:hypothetical protein
MFFHMYDRDEAIADLQAAKFDVLDTIGSTGFEVAIDHSPLLGFLAQRPWLILQDKRIWPPENRVRVRAYHGGRRPLGWPPTNSSAMLPSIVARFRLL